MRCTVVSSQVLKLTTQFIFEKNWVEHLILNSIVQLM